MSNNSEALTITVTYNTQAGDLAPAKSFTIRYGMTREILSIDTILYDITRIVNDSHQWVEFNVVLTGEQYSGQTLALTRGIEQQWVKQ